MSRTDERKIFAKRQRAEKRRRWRSLEIVFLVCLIPLLTWAGWRAVYSPQLAVKSIVVSGNERLSDTPILKLSGLRPGQPFWLVRSGLVEERLEARINWLERVVVVKRFPDRIIIQVSEKMPTARLRLKKGELLLDRNGKSLGPAAPRDRMAPVLRVGSPSQSFSYGRSNRRVATAAVRSYCLLPLVMRRRVTAIEAVSAAAITFRTKDGLTIFYGDNGLASAKNEVLKKFLDDRTASRLNFKYIDVRVPSRPALR